MGANCCIAARKNSISDHQACVHLACSPSWSLHNNQRLRNDVCDNPLLRGNSESSALEVTNNIHTRAGDYPDGINSTSSDQSPNLNTSITEEVDGNVSIRKADGGTGITMPVTEKDQDSSEAAAAAESTSDSQQLIPLQEKDQESSEAAAAAAESTSDSQQLIPLQEKDQESSEAAAAAAAESTSDSKQLIPLPSSPPSSVHRIKPLSGSITFPSGSASSRKARHSFGYRLYKQISESKLIRSFREHGPSERRSLMHSAGGLRGGLPDHWSLRLFSELVASQQAQLPLGDEKSGDGHWSPANNHKCGICLKTLNERPQCSGSQTLGRTFEVPVVAALFCGHVYHAECLENQTLEADKYDPPCPVCTSASRQGASSSKRARSKQHSRSAVGDFDLDDASTDLEQRKSFEREKISKRGFGLKSSSLTRRFRRGQT